MTTQSPYHWILQIIQLVQLFLEGGRGLQHYNKGGREIQRTLEKTQAKIQSIYFKYVLKPAVDYRLQETL